MSSVAPEFRSIASAPAAPARLYDTQVVFVVGVLMALGVTMVCSADVDVKSGFSLRDWWDSPLRQAAFALAGFLAMLTAAHLDYRVLAWRGRAGGWRAGLLLAAAAGLLVLVLVPGIGHSAGGAWRQIMLPGLGFGFQPSELAKVVLVIWLAARLTRDTQAGPAHAASAGARRASRPGDVRDLRRGFLPVLVGGGLLIGLTAIEDFGTAALMGIAMVAMLFVGGARLWHLGWTGLLAAGAGALLVVMRPHRVERILTWWSEDPDPSGAGYQINQALLAIGSGSWYGRGLGAGVQKYGYLPQDNNDFILAIICEELGVVGGVAVALLFLLLLWRGWRIAVQAPDPFGRLLATGLTIMICLQAAFNVAVVTNSVPTKGISLPFVSAGGSGVVFLGVAAGLLAAVGRGSGPGPDRSRAGGAD
jgi:cell division protein FtsW